MKLDDKLSVVIADLEFCIGSECYNPNSYDGWNDIEGCSFRYPVNFPDSNGEYTKVRSNINKSYIIAKEQVTPETVVYMKYRFGSNELMIGKGIVNILEYLEKRYGLDFNDLEQHLETRVTM